MDRAEVAQWTHPVRFRSGDLTFAVMGDVGQAWQTVREAVPEHVTVVAVSKTKPVQDVEEAYAAGARVFGENRVQELVSKHEALTHPESGRPRDFADLNWHQIGTLQRNKVKYIAPFVHLIHAVDQVTLLDEIDKRATSNGRRLKVLLQVHIAEEESKFGFGAEELPGLVDRLDAGEWGQVEVAGLMGMATFTPDTSQLVREFSGLRRHYETFGAARGWSTLSMGMSGDWRIAVEEGSTMVRIGSAIFGSR